MAVPRSSNRRMAWAPRKEAGRVPAIPPTDDGGAGGGSEVAEARVPGSEASLDGILAAPGEASHSGRRRIAQHLVHIATVLPPNFGDSSARGPLPGATSSAVMRSGVVETSRS